MSSLSPLEQAIATAWPIDPWRDVNVVVAVSGGRDSVALLWALHRLKTSGSGQLHVAHLNHGLRGDQSDADEQFVRDLASELALPIEVGRADVAAAAQQAGDGLESAARTARYDFLQQAAENCGARYVATGHTADDQVETILHRILRGTGIVGLAGMSPTRPLSHAMTLIRPLLQVTREEVDRYVVEKNIRFRDDATNEELHFTRNRLRHDLLPKLRREYNANVDDALLRLSQLAEESQAVIDGMVGDLMVTCCRKVDERTFCINCEPLATHPPHVIRQLLMHYWQTQGFPQQAMGKPQWDALAEIVCAAGDVAARDLPGGVRVEKTDDELRVIRRAS